MKYALSVDGRKLLPLFILVLSVCFTPGFILLQNYETILIGEWNAKWIIKNQGLAIDSKNQMDGHMVFNDNGNVSIKALGYPGCTFSSDTIENDLLWDISNDSLHLYNKNDQFKLSYHITKASDNFIELNLLEDIFVTLEK